MIFANFSFFAFLFSLSFQIFLSYASSFAEINNFSYLC